MTHLKAASDSGWRGCKAERLYKKEKRMPRWTGRVARGTFCSACGRNPAHVDAGEVRRGRAYACTSRWIEYFIPAQDCALKEGLALWSRHLKLVAHSDLILACPIPMNFLGYFAIQQKRRTTTSALSHGQTQPQLGWSGWTSRCKHRLLSGDSGEQPKDSTKYGHCQHHDTSTPVADTTYFSVHSAFTCLRRRQTPEDSRNGGM